jgi:hypothetical protein
MVCNIDEINNRLGEVTKKVQMSVRYEDYDKMHRFLVADIGEDNIILGYPFFKAANPLINWPMGRMRRTVMMTKV